MFGRASCTRRRFWAIIRIRVSPPGLVGLWLILFKQIHRMECFGASGAIQRRVICRFIGDNPEDAITAIIDSEGSGFMSALFFRKPFLNGSRQRDTW